MTNPRMKFKGMAGFWAIAAAVLFLVIGLLQSYAQDINPEIYSQLRYRYIGPGGNRTSAVVGVPGDPMVYYIGASSGGIWKSTDGANTWFPVFDDQPAQSIGALAIAPSDPSVVWAGTGEAFVRSNGRHRGSFCPQQYLHRKRRLQVYRCRPDLGARGIGYDRPDRPCCHSPQ